MNREILFRGKTVDNEEWVLGNLIQTEDGRNFIFNYHFIPDKSVPSSRFISVMPETVGQYTGLKDKNGKKIFEGDKVDILDLTTRPKATNCTVYWNEIIASFEGYPNDRRTPFTMFLHSNNAEERLKYDVLKTGRTIKITGNIHDKK